ncbi:MAG: 30S ribosomal protein S3Ae [Candidatus Methanolliviera sp. GoM_asphalt]|nr:MAG: 30S ribosomal protein S3Ae [Candidatus Methanolliviera sp. GoM_asphalt]
MVRKVKKTIDTWKQKRWYKIIAPEIFGKTELKETITDDPNKLIGRKAEVTLADLINDWSKQNIKLTFQIERVDGDKAYTVFISHELTQDYMRSLVRRKMSMIAGNFLVTTKDGYTVRVKPHCFTLRRVKTTKKEKIRAIMEETVKNSAKKLDFNQFMQGVVLGKLASDIYKGAKVIYPLRRVEIGKSEFVSYTALKSQPESSAVSA